MAETPAQQLVKLAMKRLGVTDHKELAVRLGLVSARALTKYRFSSDDSQFKKVGFWVTGLHAPSFGDTMTLLSEAELLSPEAAKLFPRSATAAANLEAARRALDDSQPGAGKRRSQDGRG